MTAKVEATDNLLSSESEEDEIDYSILDLSFSNSNNESVIEQEVLNTQQIFDIMKNQVKKVLDVTKVRKLFKLTEKNVKLILLIAKGQRSSSTSK